MSEPSVDDSVHQLERMIANKFITGEYEKAVQRVLASWRERGEALGAIRDSWDALPEGDNGPATFIRWLNEDMEPAIRKVRAAISSPAKSQV
jgi:hypothetical protein